MGVYEVYLLRIHKGVPTSDAPLRVLTGNMFADDEVFRAALKISKPIMDKDKGASWWLWKLDKDFADNLYTELELDGQELDFFLKYLPLEGEWYMVIT